MITQLASGGDSFELVRQFQLRESDGETYATADKIPVGYAWHFFQALVEAVTYIHACGFVHRDITPENIFLHVEQSKN